MKAMTANPLSRAPRPRFDTPGGWRPVLCLLLFLSGLQGLMAQTPARQPAGGRPPANGSATAPARPAPAASDLRAPSDSYVIQAGDTLKVSVYQEPDLDADRTVAKSGEVSLPLIGSLSLGGRTVRAAEKLIEDRYNQDYLVDPRVSVTLTGYAQHSVTVSGAVTNPGAVAIPQDGRFDVLAAIAAAGGGTDKANLRAVMVRRVSGGAASFTCDVAAMQADPAQSRELKAGDSIFVPQKVSKWVNVMGSVARPANVEVPENGRLDLLSAIANAGGFAKSAATKKVLIRRPLGGGERTFTLNAADMADGSAPLFYLLPGDTVTVNERIF